VLLLRGRPHELPTHEGMWQRSDGRNDLFDQAGQRQSVVPAVGKIALPFLGANRRTGDNPVTDIVFLRTVDPIIAEIAERTGQAVEAFLAVARADPGVVRQVAELDIWVERSRRLAPPEDDMRRSLSLSLPVLVAMPGA